MTARCGLLLWLGALLLWAGAAQAATYTAVANRDAHLREDNPNTNYGTLATVNIRSPSGNSNDRRAVIGFTLPAIPSNEYVTSATIRLWVTAENNDVISLHNVTDTWTEAGVNWTNTSADFNGTAENSQTVSSSNVYVTFTVTTLAAGWVANTTANNGVMLIGDSNADTTFASSENGTANRRPELTIITARIQPSFTFLKSSTVISDPYNGTTNPKAIPGAAIRYTVSLSNSSAGTADNNTTVVTDAVPTGIVPNGMKLRVADYGGAGSGPAAFTNGAVSSGLTYTFTSLASTTDSIAFSNNGGTTYTYTPVADADGCDAAVTHFRVSPTGAFAGKTGATDPSFTLQLRMQVK